MPRRAKVSKREINPDPKYGSVRLQKFINKVMWDGKKSLAERLVYEALDIASKKLNKEPLEVFNQALENVRPLVMVKSTRIGGATYQVPMEVDLDKSLSIAMKWMINFARARNEHGFAEKLAAELVDAFHKRGATFKKREDTHRMAEANKAFAHFKY